MLFLIFRIVLIITHIVKVDNCMPSDGFFSTQITIWPGGSAISPLIGGNYSFSFSVSPTFGTPSIYALALSGISIVSDEFFGFKTILTPSTIPPLYQIQFTAYNTTAVFQASFYLLLVSSTFGNRIFVSSYSVSSIILSNSNRTISQQSFRLPTPFSYQNTSNFVVKTFLLSLSLSSKSQNILTVNSCKIVIGSRNVQISLNVHNGTIVNFIDVTIFLYDIGKSNSINQPYQQLSLSFYNSGNTIQNATLNNFGISSFFGPDYSQNCFLGISKVGWAVSNGSRGIFFNSSGGFSEGSSWSDSGNDLSASYQLFCIASCANGTYYDSLTQSCLPCGIINCTICKNSTYCLDCDPQYLANSSGKCQICSNPLSLCLNCENEYQCLQCMNNTLYLARTAQNTIICSFCFLTISGCQTCLNESYCTSCVNNKYFLQNNTCSICGASLNFCQQCIDSTQCTKCISTFFYLENKQCWRCIDRFPYCQSCDATKCLVCISQSYYLNNSVCTHCNGSLSKCDSCNNSTVCLTCVTGFFSNSSWICQSCSLFMSNCRSCNNSLTCSQCATTSFGLNNMSLCSSCSSIQTGCSTCYNYTFCLSCTNSSYLLRGNQICIPCSHYIPYCRTCISQIICLSCQNGSLINSAFGCSTCTSILYCKTCVSINNCSECISNNYYLTNSSRCLSCSSSLSNCIECSSSEICTQCKSSQYHLNITTSKCIKCSQIIPICIECYGSTPTCALCPTGMFVNSKGGCSCITGTLAGNYCTNVSGCSSTYLQLDKVYCNSCKSDFYFQGGLCYCKKGIMASGYCVEFYGCITANLISGSLQCVTCNSKEHFTPNSIGVCECKYKYKLSNQKCVDNCGDGFVMQSECDDGNQYSGDGCSSQCKIQSGFKCFNGSTISKSSCLYYGTIGLTFIKGDRESEENIASLTFILSPAFPSRMILLSTIKIQIKCSIQIIKAQYNDGQLRVNVEFFEDLDGLDASLQIEVDLETSNSSSFAKSIFNLRSYSLPFLYTENQDLYRILSHFYEAVSYIGLISFLISLKYHKLIGAELLFTLQAAYYWIGLSKNSPFIFYSFSHLKLVCGYNSWFHKQSDRSLFGDFSRTIIISKQYLENNFIISCTLLLLAIIWIIMRIRSSFLEQRHNCLCKIDSSWTLKNVYCKLLFPFTAGFALPNLLGLYVNNLSSEQTNYFGTLINSAFITLNSFLFSLIAGFEVTNSFKRIRTQRNLWGLDEARNQSVISLFLVQLFIFNLIMSLSLQEKSIEISPFYISLLLPYTIYLLIKKPYSSSLDNVRLILKQITIVLIFTLDLINRYCFKITDKFSAYISLIIAALVLICILLTVFRVIFYVMNDCKGFQKQIIIQKLKRERKKKEEDRFSFQSPRDWSKANKLKYDLGVGLNLNEIDIGIDKTTNQNFQFDQAKQMKKKLKEQLVKIRKQKQRKQSEDF